MAKPSERMRLKDKIVDDVSKAIKSIQEQLYHASKDHLFASNLNKGHLTLSNGDRLCHKLCDKLDHAFLHGLKDVTHGYWKLVKVLSHKGMIREIDLLTNVTTDLGRGRAWLYASLNEGLLESYFRMLGENEKLLKKYYSKEALLLDTDRMNVLLTLTSGLDFVTFLLEYDLPYLDLSPSPPRAQTCFHYDDHGSKDEVRKFSIDSGPITQQSDSDSTSISSCDVQSICDRKVSPLTVSSVVTRLLKTTSNNVDATDSSITATSCGPNLKSHQVIAPAREEVFHDISRHRSQTGSDTLSLCSAGSASELDHHQRFENIVSGNKAFVDETEDSLEVIRIKGKKKKKRPKLANSIPIAVSKGKLETAHLSNDKGIIPNAKTVRTNEINPEFHTLASSLCRNKMERSESAKCEQVQKEENISMNKETIPQLDSGIDICDIVSDKLTSDNDKECDNDLVSDFKGLDTGEISDKDSLAISSKINEGKSSLSIIESKIFEMCQDTSKEETTNKIDPTVLNIEFPNGNTHKNVHSRVGDNLYKSNCAMDSTMQEHKHSPLSNEEDNINMVCDVISPSPCMKDNTLPEGEQEEYFDVYSRNSPFPAESQNRSHESYSFLTKLQEASHLQDYVDCVLQGAGSPNEDQPAEKQDSVPPEYFLSLDNNTKLQVMLEIFKQEDETFVKMFACRENHTEGHFSVAFVLISDQFLYLLHYEDKSRKFTVQSVTRLTDIIFISTGLCDQTLNIESRDKSRQKQRLWLTPGHQELTKTIVQCLSDVVKEANANIVSLRSRFSVGSDVPLQKIGLRKYISKELHCETQDVTIDDYSLVFWEDPSSSNSGYSESKTKEGILLLRTQDPTKGLTWKPVYVVLQNSMLSISNSKSDTRPHSYLGLGGDQCVGCRLTEVGERSHCVELVLAQGGSWVLSSATGNEILEWSRSLCLAVSRGVEEMGALSGCVPCCCVQANNQLFMCHEDLDTKFFRTLGRANMEDVTGVSVDREEPSYCIVEFESNEVGVSSDKWVFHFASQTDTNRFVVSLITCWKEMFKVDLSISFLDDVSLQRHCQSHAALLRKTLELR